MDLHETIMPKEHGSLRVMHTADWHLGKTLHGRDRRQEHELFLQFLLETIIQHEVDVLLIAGDVFDSTTPPQYAERQYFDFISKVHARSDCSIVVTAGNHDSAMHLEAPKHVLHALNVYVIGSMPQEHDNALVMLPSKENPRLIIAAVPFLRDRDLRTAFFGEGEEAIRRALQEGTRLLYKKMTEAAKSRQTSHSFLMAMGHLTVIGATVSDSERDIQIGGLGAVDAGYFPADFSYVALGHLHRPQTLGGENGRICYSGSPIPLSFGEGNDSKQVKLLTIRDGKLTHNQTIPIPSFRSLIQLNISRNDLDETLAQFTPPSSSLNAWVELTVRVEHAQEDLRDHVEKLCQEKPFEIIHLKSVKETFNESLTIDGLESSSSTHLIDDLLSNPVKVFSHRLDLEKEMAADKRESLLLAFKELWNTFCEEKRDSKTKEVKS